jgi:hypothetical protein
MKKRPLSITLIGFSYIFIGPVLDLLQRAWINEWPPDRVSSQIQLGLNGA